MANFTGGCLCGAVRYTCTAEPAMAGHCHCEDCRRSSGSGHSSHLGVPEQAVSMTGETKGYARAADSGHIVTRHFCPACGAPMFSRNEAMPGMLFLRASTLDDLEVFKPQLHVYTARAASWDHRHPDLPAFDKMPPGM
ncbi:GFA family protein [Terricaulis sp.]|uniref:GFA family protein n=1 Tax=Terricaulis sp. TaxID=2768686 RepID=UPI0037842857